MILYTERLNQYIASEKKKKKKNLFKNTVFQFTGTLWIPENDW